MRYRQLGDSDLQVSEICLGTWTTFGGSLADDDAIALVDAAFDAGINFFDTANTYSEGRSEEVLGRALAARPRDSYVLATKLRARAPDGGRGVSRAQVLHQIDQSLERLGAEFVDLYQCHWWDDEVPLAETLEAMTEIVEAGKVRYVGCSNWTGEQIQQAIDLAREHGYVKIVSSQPEYSLLHREPEEDVIPVSKANGISQVVYSPLAQGVLSGKYAPGEAASEGTRASARAEWMEYFEDDVLERVQRLRADRGRPRDHDGAARAGLDPPRAERRERDRRRVAARAAARQCRCVGRRPRRGDDAGRRSCARTCVKVTRVNRKLIVFVPREALDRVRDALFAAGAGRIGDYERCSWYTEGTGTFLGGEGTSPSVGRAGREERVAELRLETVFPAERQDEVIAALRQAHPYEEPAFDIYELVS